MPENAHVAPKSVLVVEDDALTALLYRRLLAGHPDEFEAFVMDDGESALRLLAERRFDAAVVDWDLPGIDGLAVIRALRASTRSCGARVLMASGRRSQADRDLASMSGADDYLAKPFTAEDLLARLNALLGSTKRHKNLIPPTTR